MKPTIISPRVAVLALLIAAAGFGAERPALGQTAKPPRSSTPAAVQREAMRRLAYMAGHWQGEGWMQRGAQRATFRGGETVQRKLDGLALLVEGRFTARPPGSDHEVPVHATLGVISYDAATERYRFATWLAAGNAGEYALTLLDDGWQWGFEVPGGKVRYTARFVGAREWIEAGEFSRDGKSWSKFFEMKLRKADPARP